VLKAQEAAADRDLEKIRCGQDRYSLLKNFAKKQSAAVSQAGSRTYSPHSNASLDLHSDCLAQVWISLTTFER